MKLQSMLPASRNGRLVLATCGGVLISCATWWMAHERSVTVPPARVQQLQRVAGPQTPKSLYEGRASGVRAQVVEALALENAVPYLRRIELLRAMDSDLASIEIDLLVAALLTEIPTPEAAGVHSTWFNEVANLLHRQRTAQERLARALATVAADSARGGTLRDYALQHLRVVWNDATGDPGLRDSITMSLRQIAVADKSVSTAALLSLHLLGDNASAPDTAITRALGDDEIASSLGVMLAGPPGSRPPAERMTAARIAADRKLASIRPALARVASDPAEHALSRISAINAIGRIGDPADRTLLESLSSADPTFSPAVRKALESLH